MFRPMSVFQRYEGRFILRQIEGGGGGVTWDSKKLVLVNWNPHFATVMNVKNLRCSWVINMPLGYLKR